jgi:hypothetical protein
LRTSFWETKGKMNKLKNYKEPNLLDAFWKLSEFKQATRVEGSKQLTAYLSNARAVVTPDDRDYVIKRLLRGLSSNRKLSRLGYSNALAIILDDNESIDFAHVLDIAEAELKFNDSTANKEELRNIYIGYAFLYLCLIKCDKRAADFNANLDKILTKLCQIRSQTTKSYIKQLYTQVLIEIIRKTDEKSFKKQILPQVSSDFEQKWLSEDALCLYLRYCNFLAEIQRTWRICVFETSKTAVE